MAAIDMADGRESTTYHPFLARKRPMAGSGSLFGVMRRGGGPQALRGLLSGVGRAVGEQGVAGFASVVEESRSGYGQRWRQTVGGRWWRGLVVGGGGG